MLYLIIKKLTQGARMDPIFMFLFYIYVAVLVYIDSTALKNQGAKIAPVLWGALTLVLNVFALLVYFIMRRFVWKPQVDKTIQDAHSTQTSITSMRVFRIAAYTIGFLLFGLMAGGHGPILAEHYHSKIKVGMTEAEVENIFRAYKDRRLFFFIHDNLATEQKDKNGQNWKRIVFMGPVFQKNDFKVYFDDQRKVKAISAVRHWD